MGYADRITDARKKQDMTQEQLAAALRVKMATVVEWENGKSQPNLLQVPLLCFVLDISYECFFGIPERKGKKHRRKSPEAAYQTSWLPVMYRYVIQYYRERKGMSQQALAKACSVKEDTVIKWQNGRSIPKLDEIPLICEALGMRTWEFFE